MQAAITISKCIPLVLIGLLLAVDLQIAIAIIDKDADFTNGQSLAFLYPNDLTVMIDRLHAVTRNPHAKIGTLRNRLLRETNHLKVPFLEELTSTSRYRKLAHRHIYVLENADHLRLRLISS